MSKSNLTDQERFGSLNFNDFKQMALNSELSCYEKIGFPNEYRLGKENTIFSDILTKLSGLHEENQVVLDIGPGCSELPLKLIDLCREKNHKLILIDSQEMLDQLPDEAFIKKIPAFYPLGCQEFIREYHNKINIILSYSVLHYIFSELNVFDFLDKTLNLLMDGGQMLLGDLPNSSKRKRFLTSSNGIKHHQRYYDKNTLPKIEHFIVEPQQMDDAVILGLLLRSRNAGFDAYVMPQLSELPMANRREDLLIIKP